MSEKRIILVSYGMPSTRVCGQVLAYVFGTRSGGVFGQLKAPLEPFGITRFYTDDWGAYSRHLDQELHKIGKQNTQNIENKHLNLRVRIKRLVKEFNLFLQDGYYARRGDWTVC